MKKICISEYTYNRLAKYAYGFMTPSDAIDSVLDLLEGKESEQNNKIIEGTKSSDGRDFTKYTFNNSIYSKSKLVHAVISQYVEDYPETTFNKLKSVFPDELQAFSLPVFMKWDEANNKYHDKNPKRFYIKNEMKISLYDCDIATCNQWGVDNINNLINRAIDIGYKIETCED